MPVEIRELVIRAVVDGEPPGDSVTSPEPDTRPAPDSDELVRNCVREVLKILKHSERR